MLPIPLYKTMKQGREPHTTTQFVLAQTRLVCVRRSGDSTGLGILPFENSNVAISLRLSYLVTELCIRASHCMRWGARILPTKVYSQTVCKVTTGREILLKLL